MNTAVIHILCGSCHALLFFQSRTVPRGPAKLWYHLTRRLLPKNYGNYTGEQHQPALYKMRAYSHTISRFCASLCKRGHFSFSRRFSSLGLVSTLVFLLKVMARDTVLDYFFSLQEALKIEGTDELKRKLLKLLRTFQEETLETLERGEETLETLERFPLEIRVERDSWNTYVRARPIQLPEMQVL